MRFAVIASSLLTVGLAYSTPTAGRPSSPPPPSGGDNNGNVGGTNTGNICPSDKPNPQCCQSSGLGLGILPINLGELFCQFNAFAIGSGNCNADVYCCQDNSVPSSGISLINIDVSCIKLL